MFDKANWSSSCANRTAGFTDQNGETLIPTRLIVKVLSGGCSDRVDASASCCKLRSREEYCTYSRHYAVSYLRCYQCGIICINYQVHTHAQFYVHTTLFILVLTITAYCLSPLCSSHLHLHLLCYSLYTSTIHGQDIHRFYIFNWGAALVK